MKEYELSSLPADLQDRKVSLQTLGISEYGWELDDVRSVVSTIRSLGRAVIGGDIYYESGGVFEPAYANWWCEPEKGESKDAFLTRSAEYALVYAKGVSVPPGKKAIFVVVPGDVI